MLFDLRGKRKRLVQVVYGALALLMGGGLIFFGIGSSASGGLSEIFGSGSSGTGQNNDYEKEAAQIDQQLLVDKKNQELLLRLVRARILSGNSKSPADSATGEQVFSEESLTEFQKAADAWERYLKTKPNPPDSAVALLMANSYIALAQNQNDLLRAVDDVKSAAAAQQIYADAKPSLGSLSQLALYLYLAGDSAGGDAAGDAALKLATDENREQLRARLKESKTQGEQLQKEVAKAKKKKPGAPQEGLDNPLGGLGGGGGLSAPAP